MNVYQSLGWFYWDPPKEAFTVPFTDHAVVWYGILFVAGFILGYFIFNPILTRFLIQIRHLSAIDINNWPYLVEELRNSSSPLIAQLMAQFNPSTRQQLQQKAAPLITPHLKQSLLEGLNRFLKQTSTSREDLQQVLGPSLASPKQTAYFLTDRLLWFVIAGTVIGARLGIVFFYDWPYFRQHPIEIFKIWHGGLASHGGVIGVMIAIYFYTKYVRRWVPQLTVLQILDFIAVPAAVVLCFIRLGNFMNQEILGTPTTVPWAIIFGHPADGSTPIPRHPVQLYEAGAYLIIFWILWFLWKKQRIDEQPGLLVGMIFILGFGSRFILEFWKANQESIIHTSFLQAGQILSIPFLLLGIFLVWKSKCSFSYKSLKNP
jgi:phosphatidylglycerol:prolipoprotein diacylglycerol transferase